MNEKELEEQLADIRNLLVAQLLAAGVKTTEIEEILQLGVGNFNKRFQMRKLIARLESNGSDVKRKKKTKK